MADSGIVLVSTVIDDRAKAERIARELVEARRAACVQVAAEPVTSVYRWPNEETGELELQSEREWSVTAKTTAAGADACVAAIVELHPYDTPEVLITPVLGGHPAYLEWVAAEIRAA
jgi:periplasmic divalent cation tolerance protein